MARPHKEMGLSIAKLESTLRSSREKLQSLEKDRDRTMKALSTIESKIAVLTGGASGSGGKMGRTRGRARNAKSLAAVLADVLAHGKSQGVGEIVDAVLATGYQSTSPNFRGIVNQTLIKEKKQFGSAGRGLYQLKK